MKKHLYKLIAAVLLVLTATMPNLVLAADTLVDATSILGRFASSPATVWVNDQTGFVFYIGAEGDLEMASSTDGGSTWVAGRTVDGVNTTDVVNYAVWWDGWSPTTTAPTTIHITTIDSGVDDSYYVSYNVASNTLSTTTLISTQGATCDRNNTTACPVSITKSRDGDLYVSAMDTNDRWVFRCPFSSDCTQTASWSEVTPLAMSALEGAFVLAPLSTSNNVFGFWRNTTTAIKWGEYSPTTTTWHASGTLSGTYSAAAENRYTALTLTAATSSATITAMVLWDSNDFTTQDHDIRAYNYSSAAGMVQATDAATNVSGGLVQVNGFVDYSSTTAPTLYAIYSRRTTIDVATTTNIYYRTSTSSGSTWTTEQGPVNDTTDDIAGPFSSYNGNERLTVAWQYVTAPNDNDVYMEEIANLTPWTPPGGGGGGGGTGAQSEFFFGWILPYLGRCRKRGVL